MAFVSVPKDLAKVKNKVVFNLTRRQMICLAAAAAVGLPFYFLTRDVIGTSNAASGMVLFMLPAFMFAMYEKDGQPMEKVLFNIISVKLIRPAVRRYETVNYFDIREEPEKKGGRTVRGEQKRDGKQRGREHGGKR